MLTLPIMLCLAATPAALDNTDVFLESAGERALPVLGPRLEQLVGLGVVSRVEPRLGVPSSFFALRLGPAAPSWAGAGLSPAEAARRYLLDYAPLYRLGGHDVATLSVTRVHDAVDDVDRRLKTARDDVCRVVGHAEPIHAA